MDGVTAMENSRTCFGRHGYRQSEPIKIVLARFAFWRFPARFRRISPGRWKSVW